MGSHILYTHKMSLARKQLNDGVAIFSHIYDEWKAASSKQ